MRRAVDAVLTQDYEGFIEVVVVFDKSEPDMSLEMEEDNRRIRVISNQRSPGLAGARNTGIAATSSAYVAFCDDDDEWLPSKLRRQIDVLEADEFAQVAVCGIRIVYDDRTVDRVLNRDRLTFQDFLADRIMEAHPSTVVFRRSLNEAIGPVDENLPGGYYEDYEWLLRAARIAPIASVNVPLVNILWGATSYYTGKFEMIEKAVKHLLNEYPDFDDHRKGKGRLMGQIAFAQAGQDKRGEAVRAAIETVKLDPIQPRAYLALVAASGVMDASRILAELNKRGRGV